MAAGGKPPIYTKTGDDGTTGLLFGGRVSKADPVVEVCGAVDEAVAALGMARASLEDQGLQAIVLDLAAGESLSDHQVHERAWLVVLDGEIQVATAEGERVSGGVGLLVEFAPGERHEVIASADARLLLLLTPWPGSGHPGAMTIREKLYARRRAAKQAGEENQS